MASGSGSRLRTGAAVVGLLAIAAGVLIYLLNRGPELPGDGQPPAGPLVADTKTVTKPAPTSTPEGQNGATPASRPASDTTSKGLPEAATEPGPEPDTQAPEPQTTADASRLAPDTAPAPGTSGESTQTEPGPATQQPQPETAQSGQNPASGVEGAGQDASQPGVPPTFDLVRVSPEGDVVIAGRSGPGYDIRVLIDRAEVFATKSDARGAFVALFTIPLSDQPREVTLLGIMPNGQEVVSQQAVFLTPPVETPAPQVAETTPGQGDVTAPSGQSETLALALPQSRDAGAGEPAKPAPATSTGEPASPAAGGGAATPLQPESGAAAPTAVLRLEDLGKDVTAGSAQARIGASIPAAPLPGGAAPVPSSGGSTVPSAGPESAPTSLQAGNPAAPVMAEPQVAGTEAPVAPRAPTAETMALAPEAGALERAGAESAAPRAPGVILADERGIRVLQSPDPQNSPRALSNIVIDSISYDAAGEVAISGHARLGNFVRVYVDNKPISTLDIQEDGSWRTELPEVDSGVYTLRIDEIDASGAVKSRVETPFKREEPSVLAQAIQNAARDGFAPVTLVTVQHGYTLWGIARSNYGSGVEYVRIFDANKDQIRNPDLIYPGQVFTVPSQDGTSSN